MIEVDFAIQSVEEQLLDDLCKIMDLEFATCLSNIYIISAEPIDLAFVFRTRDHAEMERLRMVIYHLEAKYAYRIFINSKLLGQEELELAGILDQLEESLLWTPNVP